MDAWQDRDTDAQREANTLLGTLSVTHGVPLQNAPRPTLGTLKCIVKQEGYTIGTCYETADRVYASSREEVRGTYGHPAFEAYWHV